MWTFSRRGLTVGELRAEHDAPRGRHAHTVQQGVAPEVEVDERCLHPHLGQAQPEGHLQRPALHEDGHHVPGHPSLTLSPVGHGVGDLVQLGEGPRFTRGLVDQGRLVRIEVDRLGEDGGDVASVTHVPPQGHLHPQEHVKAPGYWWYKMYRRSEGHSRRLQVQSY